MKYKFILLFIMFLLIMFPKDFTYATFPIKSNYDEPNIVIITPCSRPQNLEKIKESIDLSKIKRWYISYDCQDNKMEFVKRFPSEPKIKELKCVRPSITGNGPRNEALDEIVKTEGKCMVYFLDDDTILHENLLKKDLKLDKIYTWDLYRGNNPVSGGSMEVGYIDTAQFMVDIDIIGNLRWGEPNEARGKDVRSKNSDAADGNFITTLYKNNKDKWEYIPEPLAYYNFLNK